MFPGWRRTLIVYLPFVVLFFLALKLGWLIPDGLGYSSYLPTLFLDGDLHLWNQYALTGMIKGANTHGAAVTSNGYVSNPWCIGASLLWVIFWLLGHALTYIALLWGQTWTPHGFSVYYNMGIRFGTAIFGFTCLLLTFHWCKRYTSSRSAAFTVILIALGTPFYWYTFLHADLAHIPAAFIIALFLLVWDFDKLGSDYRNGFLLGLLGGLITIIKPNDILVFLFPLASSLKHFNRKKMTAIVLGALIAGSLQMWVWQIMYGYPLGPIQDKGLTHSYGFHYGFFTGHFRLLDVLFSSYHGLFFFSPVLLLSFIGLILLTRKDRLLGIVSLIVLMLQILLMAGERYFWEGAAFGLRRLVDWTPLLAMGLACALHKLKKPVLIAAITATLWTILLAVTYSGLPASVLYDFQPPSVILKWAKSTLTVFPYRILSMLDPSAPLSIFVPGIIVFSVPGLLLLKTMASITNLQGNHAESSSQFSRSSLFLTCILLFHFLAGYALVARAAFNEDSAAERYAGDVSQLAQNQKRGIAQLEAESLLREGEYLGLTRNWEIAKESFKEALRTSHDRDFTLKRIRSVVEKHLGAKADSYLSGMWKVQSDE